VHHYYNRDCAPRKRRYEYRNGIRCGACARTLVHSFPNAGFLAELIFAIGIIGLGLLAVPVLAGSAAYALSEAFSWHEGLYRKFREAHGFMA